MKNTLLTALAAATILSGGMLASRTAAMAPVAAIPGLASDHVGPVREAAIVCGGNGCIPVQTKAHQRRKFKPLGHG